MACGSLYNISVEMNNIPAEIQTTIVRGNLKELPWHSMFAVQMQNTNAKMPKKKKFTYACVNIFEVEHVFWKIHGIGIINVIRYNLPNMNINALDTH